MMNNNTEQQNLFKQFKVVKLIQMILLIAIEVTFFCFLFLKPDFRNSLYTNPHLFVLASFMWILMIVSFVFIYYDFRKMEGATKNTYKLGKLAYLDTMTGIPNRYSCDLIFKTYCNGKNLDTLGCGIMEISNLTAINDKHGYEQGDEAIQNFCYMLDEVGSEYGFVGRNSGNEYLAIFELCDQNKMEQFFSSLQKRIDAYNQSDNHIPIEFDYAYVLNQVQKVSRFADLITLAYKKLHDLI